MKLITVLFIILSGCQFLFADRLTETFKKTIEIDGQDYFELSNRNGSIEIVGWDKTTIAVEADKVARADDHEKAQEILKETKIIIEKTDDKIIVYVKYPGRQSGSGGFLSWLFNGGSWNVLIDFKVFIPRKMNMDVSSTNGTLDVEGSQGETDLETTNGDINAAQISGSVNCYTTNGSIKVALDKAMDGREMAFKTTNGSIRLYLPATIDADLDAKTTNGHINCDLPIKTYDVKSKKKIYGKINSGGPTIMMRTTNGNIKIRES